MKIITMAGMGKRLRPLTLTTPKPLIPVAGKPIVQHLVEDITKLYQGSIEEIAFVIGDFGAETEKKLHKIANDMGAKATIHYQNEPLGTAHAIHCAKEALDGEVVIAFADTLFRANFVLDRTKDGVIWVKTVEDPRSFGVVTVDKDGNIENMIEKPENFVSNLAIIGIYYIKEGKKLLSEIEYLLQNDLRSKGEYQLTDALENMKQKGAKFLPGEVDEWMDCGNKDNVLATNARVLEIKKNESPDINKTNIQNSIIIPPCYIPAGASIENSIVGPYVSIGEGAKVKKSIVSSTVIMDNVKIENENISNSLIGNHVHLKSTPRELNLGDYSAF